MTPTLMNIIANEQGEIFEFAEKKGYNMNSFILQYMSSDFCNNEMDSDYSFFHLKPAEVCFPYIEKEVSYLSSSSETINEAMWVGKMYRLLVFKLGISSNKLVKLISPKELDNMAVTYDLYDTEDAVSEIAKEIINCRS